MKKLLISLLWILCLHASCARHEHGGEKPGDKAVEFVIDARESTRAKVDDLAINTLDVMVFQRQAAYANDPDRSVFLYSRYAMKLSDGRWRTNLTVGENLDIYFAVNVRTLVDNLAADPAFAGIEYREAVKLLLLDTPGAGIGSGGLPMWGSIEEQTIADKPVNNLGKVFLLRSVASTDIRLLATGFTFQSASLCYAADCGLLPFAADKIEPDLVAADGSFQATGPYVPDGMLTGTPDWTYNLLASDGNVVEDIFYMYENDMPDVVTPGRNSTKLVLAGVWDDPEGSGNTTYYPIALRSKDLLSGDMVKSPVVRNNKYIVVITAVNGDGFPSFDDAKDAEPMNMDFDVIPWDEQMDGGIIIDGMQYIMLQRDRNERRDDRTAVVYRNAGSDDRIVFRTNIPLDQFAMTLDGGGDFPDPSDKTVIANGRFKVEIKTVSGESFFNFTALAAYGTSLNPSTLTVKAGRIRFAITIIQRDNNPDDWDDGGEFDKDLG